MKEINWEEIQEKIKQYGGETKYLPPSELSISNKPSLKVLSTPRISFRKIFRELGIEDQVKLTTERTAKFGEYGAWITPIEDFNPIKEFGEYIKEGFSQDYPLDGRLSMPLEKTQQTALKNIKRWKEEAKEDTHHFLTRSVVVPKEMWLSFLNNLEEYYNK